MRLILGALFLLVQIEVVAASAVELRFKPFTKLAGETQIHLLSLIEDQGLNPEIIQKLKNVIIADAPKLGEQRVFTSQMLSEVLRRQMGGRDFTLRIPSQITVVNRGYEISEDVLRTELSTQWQGECKDCRFKLSSVKVPLIPVALKNRPWKLATKSGMPRGSFSEQLIVTAADGNEQIFWVNGKVEIEKKVPVANRTLNSNFRLTPEDFRLEWREVTFATDGTLGESEMIGQQVRSVIPAGQIIWAGSMTRERAVKRGDVVRVVTGSDDWQVVLQAVTEQDAYVGDRVNVRNLQTKKIITGEVVAPGEVVIR